MEWWHYLLLPWLALASLLSVYAVVGMVIALAGLVLEKGQTFAEEALRILRLDR